MNSLDKRSDTATSWATVKDEKTDAGDESREQKLE